MPHLTDAIAILTALKVYIAEKKTAVASKKEANPAEARSLLETAIGHITRETTRAQAEHDATEHKAWWLPNQAKFKTYAALDIEIKTALAMLQGELESLPLPPVIVPMVAPAPAAATASPTPAAAQPPAPTPAPSPTSAPPEVGRAMPQPAAAMPPEITPPLAPPLSVAGTTTAPPPVAPSPVAKDAETEYHEELEKLEGLLHQETAVSGLLKAFIDEIKRLKKAGCVETDELAYYIHLTYRRLTTSPTDPTLYSDHAKEITNPPSRQLKYLGALMLALAITTIALGIAFFPPATAAIGSYIGLIAAEAIIGAAIGIISGALTWGGLGLFRSQPSALCKTMIALDNKTTEKDIRYTVTPPLH